jgi:secreted PhoX family phosphatase
VAQFADDGSGTWLPLTPDHPALAGWTLPEILINTRTAADLVGATPLDRPEWTTVAPNGDCYLTCTNNTDRGRTDRFDVYGNVRPDADGPSPRNLNQWGHILKWRDTDDYVGTSFQWDVFLLAGPGGGVAGSTLDADDGFGSPDGLWADPNGLLWIQTDGGQPDGANDQMLVADPATGELKRFLTGVRQCEVTGVTMTPDQRTMFVNIQHPGDGGGSTWPSGSGLPRPATVVITKDDGGVIGT